jgi:magnesium-transporting ATPase (P-type)
MKPPHAIAVITLLKYFLSLIFFLTLELNVFKGLRKNYIFVGVVVFTVVVQVIFVEFGGAFFSTKPLSFWQWLSCVSLGFTVVPLGMNSIHYP